MEALQIIENRIHESIAVKQLLLEDKNILIAIKDVSTALVAGFRNGNKLLLCGNGGSAADAQHLAAEFSGRYYYDRPPLYAEALHVNTSYVTAVANDYSFNMIYQRLVQAMGNKGDALIGLSTSGNSTNVVNAIREAKSKNMLTIGFTGKNGGTMKKLCDYIFCIPSDNTPRIQEAHIMIGHIICELVEATMFPKP